MKLYPSGVCGLIFQGLKSKSEISKSYSTKSPVAVVMYLSICSTSIGDSQKHMPGKHELGYNWEWTVGVVQVQAQCVAGSAALGMVGRPDDDFSRMMVKVKCMA